MNGLAGRRLNVPSLAFGALTLWLAFVGITTLSHDGQLDSALAVGRAELAAPAFLGLVAVVVVCERIWPAQPRPLFARGHLHDLCFLAVYLLGVVPLVTLIGVAFATLLLDHAPWLAVSWTQTWPRWLLVVVALVAMDAGNWLAHWAEHRLGLLWRWHAVHHSQEELSVLTSFRAHPFVHTTGFLLATVPVVVLTAHQPMAPVLIMAYLCLGTLPHANVPWSFGPLDRVLVSPAYHRIHHAIDGPGDLNFGIVLSIWDVLARTAVFPTVGAPACQTGLAGRPIEVEQAVRTYRPISLLTTHLLEPFTAMPKADETLALPVPPELVSTR
jgi:sterol desaturase/sphingolipid hydroxylase (fatty acid hydroxylase superfamily)